MKKSEKSFLGVMGIILIIYMIGPLIVFPLTESPKPFGVMFWFYFNAAGSFMLIFMGDEVRPYGTTLFISYCVVAMIVG